MAELAARSGIAFRLSAQAELVVTNTHGQQVVDTWAYSEQEPDRHVSAPHTWMHHGRLNVREGDDLLDTMRTPMLRIANDSSEGHHDLLIPSCDIHRYRELGVEGYHDNCRDNFAEAVAALGIASPQVVPQPLNFFMHVPVSADGSFTIAESTARPGDTIRLKALQDIVIVMSACPQDLAATNGLGRTPSGVEYHVQH